MEEIGLLVTLEARPGKEEENRSWPPRDFAKKAVNSAENTAGLINIKPPARID
jgi:hypothetical protein